MFKDRRVLMEQEILNHKINCGLMYKKIVMGMADANDSKIYESMKLKLMDMSIELGIVDQMIAQGAE
jgi:hypothetical protein